jgi:hypothetical protein
MRKHILVGMIAISVLAFATVAMAADDPFVGTWKMNVAKSKFNLGPAPKSRTQTITTQGNGHKVVTDSVSADGTSNHQEIITMLDGKERPVTGNPNADRRIQTRIDANTITNVLTKGGRVVASMRLILSQDHQTLTTFQKGKNQKGEEQNNTIVWDKQ